MPELAEKLECKQQFESCRKPTQRLFCSKECREKERGKRRRTTKGKELRCLHCNQAFLAGGNKSMFCSKRCRYESRKTQIYNYNNVRRRNLKKTHPWRMPIEAAKGRAIIKKISCDLTEAWGLKVWTGYCAVSGLPFKYERSSKGPSIFAPSIDRIDSNKGYTQDNCRFVLACINFFKNNGTDEEMFAIAEAIVTARRRAALFMAA